MSLWAHGVDHGIVVNIGQMQTFAVVIVRGQVALGAAIQMGSARLTNYLLSLMTDRHDLDPSLMTWCRDMKELHCYVAPPAPFSRGGQDLQARLGDGDDFGIMPVEVQTPEGRTLQMAEERVLVPELFFDQRRPGATLPQLILHCAEATLSRGLCSEEGARTLLQQIVLVGGAADFPGMRPRVEFEVRELLRHRGTPALRAAVASTDDVYVLNPPVGHNGPLITPRFVPLFGGCVRAASSLNLDEPLQALVPGEGEEALTPRTSHVASTAALLRSQLLRRVRAGAAVFRTGGGGGEDDQAWQLFWQDMREEEDDSDEDEVDSPDYEMLRRSESESEGSPGEGTSSAAVAVAREQLYHQPMRSRRLGRPGGAADEETHGQGKGKGKGKRAKGKGQGKGKRQRVWRPVAQPSSA